MEPTHLYNRLKHKFEVYYPKVKRDVAINLAGVITFIIVKRRIG